MWLEPNEFHRKLTQKMIEYGIKDIHKYIVGVPLDGPISHPPCTIEELLASCGMKEEF